MRCCLPHWQAVYHLLDDPQGENPGGGEEPVVETVELSGNVEGTMTLDAETEYILAGTLTVPDGATLEIPAGTKIKAKQGFGNYIIVAQGGKINARGTAQAPIIFTAEDESNAGPGYWGGLIINGKAPISGPAGTTATLKWITTCLTAEATLPTIAVHWSTSNCGTPVRVQARTSSTTA